MHVELPVSLTSGMPGAGTLKMIRGVVQISLAVMLTFIMAHSPASANDATDCSITVRKSSEAACTRIINGPANSQSERFMAYYNRGWYHRRAGDLTRALADFDSAEQLNRDYANLYLSRAMVKCELDDLEGAIADLDIYAVFEPRDWNGYFQRAVILRRMGKPEKALAALERALELKPYERVLKPLRVLVLSDLGRQAEAQSEADRLVATRRSDVVSRYARAVVSFRRGNLDEAVSDLDAAVKRQAMFPAASALRGQILELRGEIEDAKSQYHLALKLAGPTIDQETARDLARRRLDALDSGPTERVALQDRQESPFSRPGRNSRSNVLDVANDCRRYVPSAAATVSVPCR
jgi:tetratricopeptide (TPR) repeat protein